MPVGAVVGHEIQDHLQAPRMGDGQQSVEVLERPEQRIDGAVIGHVVTEIDHRRGIDRRDPDRIDAEHGEIVEPQLDTLQVANPVAVRVLKGARVDLVDHALLPPRVAHANIAAGMWMMRHARSACSPSRVVKIVDLRLWRNRAPRWSAARLPRM